MAAKHGGRFSSAVTVLTAVLGVGMACAALYLVQSARVLHRHIRHNFAVNGDVRGFQPGNKLAVRKPGVSRCRSNTLNPQAAELALFVAAIAQ